MIALAFSCPQIRMNINIILPLNYVYIYFQFGQVESKVYLPGASRALAKNLKHVNIAIFIPLAKKKDEMCNILSVNTDFMHLPSVRFVPTKSRHGLHR